MFLNIFLEVILLTIIVGGSYYGYSKGFFKIAARPARILLCLALSFTFSRVVGSIYIAPVISSRINEGVAELASSAINGISTVIAFLLLFLIIRFLLSIVISLIEGIFDNGIIGKINKALGVILAGVISLLFAMSFASLAEYILNSESFRSSNLLINFTGGPLYRLFIFFSPIRLLFTR